jgi:predicted transcriptional regulator
MNAILSIKPKYVRHIIDGTKRFEFRKQPLPKAIKRVFIYSSAPEQRIIGHFQISQIVEDTPKNLWNRFSKKAGISSTEFFEYYAGRQTGYAISISKLFLLEQPVDPYKHMDNFNPPQSFSYLREPKFLQKVSSPSMARNQSIAGKSRALRAGS